MSKPKPVSEPTSSPGQSPPDTTDDPDAAEPTRRRRPAGRRLGATGAGLAAGLRRNARKVIAATNQRGRGNPPATPATTPSTDQDAPQPRPATPQGEIDFAAAPTGTSGYDRYRREREDWLKQESERLGLPLGKRVEVDIGLGRKATGIMQLDESSLLLDPDNTKPRLRVGRLVFEIHEIERCLRVDD